MCSSSEQKVRRLVLSAPQGKVSIQKIKIDRDLGNNLQVQGLSGSDQVIVNPSDSLADGDQVQVKAPADSGRRAAKE